MHVFVMPISCVSNCPQVLQLLRAKLSRADTNDGAAADVPFDPLRRQLAEKQRELSLLQQQCELQERVWTESGAVATTGTTVPETCCSPFAEQCSNPAIDIGRRRQLQAQLLQQAAVEWRAARWARLELQIRAAAAVQAQLKAAVHAENADMLRLKEQESQARAARHL